MIDGWAGPAAACVAVTLSGLLDALDGAVAVQSGRTTTVGFLLDSALDRLSDAALPVAVAIVADNPAAGELAVAVVATTWWLEYVRARGALAAATLATGPTSQVITPGERPTRMILAGVGLGLPFLALAALWGLVVIVGGSALFLFGWTIRRLSAIDQHQAGDPPSPTPGSSG
jgi:phosphatidylglycerophosphate synthase